MAIKKKFLGFTIIELIFVIAILGVMASLGLAYMQKQTERHRVNKAALQIQQVLQAGMSYEVENTQGKDPVWPIYPKDPTLPDFIAYLPFGDVKNPPHNPWGDSGDYIYRYGPYDNLTHSVGTIKAYFTGSTPLVPAATKIFGVWTTVPSVKIANQIIGLLPNAQAFTVSGKTVVLAEVTVPGQTDSSDQIVIKTLKSHYGIATFEASGGVTVTTLDDDTIADCPQGETTQVIPILTGFEARLGGGGALAIKTFSADIKYNAAIGHWQAHVTFLTDLGRGKEGYGASTARISYFSYCEKN